MMAHATQTESCRRRIGKDRRGVIALDYAVIASVVSAAVIFAATTFGGSLSTAYADIGDTLNAVAAQPPATPASP